LKFIQPDKTTAHEKNKLLYILGILALGSALTFTSCKKKKAFNDEDGQASIDNKNVQSENDAAVNDVNDVISQQPMLHGRSSSTTGTKGVTGTLCGLTVDTNASARVL